MLKNAKAYEQELKEKMDATVYNPKYQWASGSWGNDFWSMPENSYDSRVFVSVNEKNEVIGVILYQFKISCMRVDGLCAMSFAEGGDRWIYGRDLRQCIDDMFRVYNFHSVEWHCYEDNPALRGYLAYLKKCGGRVVGMRNGVSRLLDGKVHNDYIFEIMRMDYMGSKMGEYMRKRGDA